MDLYENRLTYQADYVDTTLNRKCKMCKFEIKKSELTITVIHQTIYRNSSKFYYHLKCVFKQYCPTSTSKIRNFFLLTNKDQQLIRDEIEKNGRSQNNLEREEEIILQNDKFQEYRIKLMKLTEAQLHDIHSTNMEHEELHQSLNLAADFLAFGDLQTCDTCENGQLVLGHNRYVCNGTINNYSKCWFNTQQPRRQITIISERLKQQFNFLNSYQGEVEERLFHVNEPNEVVSNTIIPNPVLLNEIGAVNSESKFNLLKIFEQDGIKYDALLILSDLQKNQNEFYRITIYQLDVKPPEYKVYTSFGRIGIDRNNLNNKSTSGEDDCSSAVKSFRNTYKLYTKNNFGDEPFKKQYGSYSAIGSSSNSKGRSVLQNIRTLIEENGTKNQLISATNEFFTLIPHDVGMSAATLLDSVEIIEKIENNLINAGQTGSIDN